MSEEGDARLPLPLLLLPLLLLLLLLLPLAVPAVLTCRGMVT